MARWNALGLIVALAGAAFAADEPARRRPAYAPAAASATGLTPPANIVPASPASEPIDLPTVLRLVNENSPAVGFARARVAEALALQDRADVLWLPNLAGGATYFRLDGQTQNQRGEVFSVSRSNLFPAGALQLRLDVADALFRPLVARRVTSSVTAAARATGISAQFDAASAYLDLLSVNAAIAVSRDTLSRAEQMLKYAKSADAAGLSKSKADVNRAQTEVFQRRQEQILLNGQAGAASARLVRLLLLPADVRLHPADPAVVPVTLVNPACSLEELLATANASRPDLAAERAAVQAATERERQARLSPYIPKSALDYQIGAFGGGRNSNLNQFDTRSVGGAQLYWELNSLGLGDAARIRERRALVAQAQYRLADVQARAGAEVVESARLAAARYDTLDDAQKAITEALEMYRKLQESSLNMLNQRGYDSIEPLLAIQALNSARLQYLSAVIEFNRAQLRLYSALGQPVECALPEATPHPTAVPVLPAPFKDGK